jgi:WD40 repeat protein
VQRRRIDALAWSQRGGWLLSGTHDGVVRLWDYEYGRQVFEWPRSGPVTSLALSPDGQWLAAGTVAGHLRVFQMTDGALIAQFSSGMIGALAWHPQGRFLVVGHENDITLYDVEGKVVGATMKRHERSITDLAWSSDGTTIASGGADATVCIWTTTPGPQPAHIVQLDEAVSAVGWSRDSRRLVVVTLDGVITLFDAVTVKVLARRHTWSGTLHDVAWSPVRELIATASGDGTVRVWGSTFAGEPPPVRQFRTPNHRTIAKMAWAPAGDRIAMTLDDGSVHVVGIDGRETAPWENSTSLPAPASSEWTLTASASEVEVRAADGAPVAWYALPLGVISLGSRVSQAASPDGRHWAVVINGVLHAFALNP